jgi:hypothetical protein
MFFPFELIVLESSRSVLKEELEDIKGVIRICISKKNRQHNGQKKKYKRTNNNQQKEFLYLSVSESSQKVLDSKI